MFWSQVYLICMKKWATEQSCIHIEIISRKIQSSFHPARQFSCNIRMFFWSEFLKNSTFLLLRTFQLEKWNDGTLSIVSGSNFVRIAEGSRIPISEEFLGQEKASAIE